MATIRYVPMGIALVLLSALVLPQVVTPVSAETVTEVKVESIKPEKEKHETLRFLKENRAFIRARLDLLRQTTSQREAGALAIDPRYLTYKEMLAAVEGAGDSLAAAEDSARKHAFLESVTQLGDLESRLDMLERLLAEQRSRLGTLEQDFTGRQKTALMVLVTGSAGVAAPAEVAITIEDGTTHRVPLTPMQRESLMAGGIAQVFHEFVEPREQVIEIAFPAVPGAEPAPGGAGFVTLDPARDRLTFLKLDLSHLDSASVAGSVRATTWLLDAENHLGAR